MQLALAMGGSVDTDQWVVRVALGYKVGHWRAIRPLASGSWSSVYEAERDPAPSGASSQPVRAALKFIPTGTLTGRQLAHLADMTDRELAVHRQLTHPSLIKVWDTHVVDDPSEPKLDGATVLALELAAGSAAAALTAAGGTGLPDAPRMIAEICAGLAHLHEAGWVHGDLKPGNVLLMADGSVRLTDFGLAAELSGTHAYLPPGGTADYMPPERWAEGIGVNGVAVRQTADIWALGVTACQLLTGRLPFSGVTSRARASAATAYTAGRAELALPATLSPYWRQFITDCLAPDHVTRQQHSAASLLQRLQDPDGQPSAQMPTGGPSRGRGRRAAAAAGLAVILLGAGGALLAVAKPWERTEGAGAKEAAAPTTYGRYFRTDLDIPPQYYDLIVQAGTKCSDNPAVSPLLIAAMLKAESNFDANLSDPAKDEYGIARWTPTVLQYYLPPGQRGVVPTPPFSPEMSIPPVGDYLCKYSATLETVPGDPMINVAAAYRTSSEVVRKAGGVPDRPAVQDYVRRLRANLATYRPVVASTAPEASDD